MTTVKQLFLAEAHLSEHQAEQTTLVSAITISPMEWYRLTESSRNILNNVITTAAKEKIKEGNKTKPDKSRIEHLTSLYLEAQKVSQDSTRFESLKSMSEIIDHYQKVLQSIR